MNTDIILGIGDSRFPELLFTEMQPALNLRQLVAYRYSAAEPVELLFAKSANDEDNMRRTINVYSRHLYDQDPILPHLSPVKDRDVGMYFVDASTIASDTFRNELYRAQKMGSKTSIVIRRPSDTIALSLFRGEEAGAVTEAQMGFLDRSRNYIAAAVERHIDLADRSRRVDWATMLSSIEGRPPLSRQEIMVCSQILEGYYNEGISLNMGLSVHSVITYRRRAFSKLGVSSQNELFSLLVQRHMH